MDMKNDRKDDKTRWELMPLDCLEDIARVYTEGAKKYDDNTWQNLENGYERYKGALLRHLYAAESEIFDEETGCRHLAQVAWNAIALLWISKHREGDIAPEAARKQKLIDDFWEVVDAYNEIIKADCDAISSKEQKYMFTDIEEKLDQILLNQQVILLYLKQILQDTNRSQFAEDYAANLAAQMTEIILGNNIVRK
jgi:hypothetical protein